MKTFFERYNKRTVKAVTGLENVFIRPLSVERYIGFSEAADAQRVKFSTCLAAASICDENGVFIVPEPSFGAMDNVAELVVSKIFVAAAELNGIELFRAEDQSEAEEPENPTSADA